LLLLQVPQLQVRLEVLDMVVLAEQVQLVQELPLALAEQV
jgi:hypothetical protein